MVEIRRQFHEQLADLESIVVRMGEATGDQFGRALEALASGEVAAADAVIAGDDRVDAFYVEIEQDIVALFALQSPVASDLRLLTAMLHINLHLERIADMAVNIAKIVKAVAGLPRHDKVLSALEEMGEIATSMLGWAMQALVDRDARRAHELTVMDDPLDALNRGMLAEVLMISDRPTLEWGINMHVVSRQIERVGDHAVDIGEQVAYLVTGVFQEFTDASHPEVEESARLADALRAGSALHHAQGGDGR